MSELYHYGVGHLDGGKSGRYPWGSGKKGNNPSILSSRIYEKAKGKEPLITKDVKKAARLANSKMHGLEHRLKTRESIKRKIKTDSLEKSITQKEAAESIKDAVRYTTITDSSHFVSAYNIFKGYLESSGYKEIRCKNYFELYRQGKVKHKSVQSIFQDKEGYRFEVQFQTPASQRAKNLKLPIYEERRKPGLSPERQQELERKMEELAENVEDPTNIRSIKTH